MMIPIMPTYRGLSDTAQEAAQFTSVGGSVGGAAVAAGVPLGLVAPATASLAIPLIGVGVAAVIGATALIENSGCGQTCIITANDANKIEPYLQQNLAGYFSGPRTLASQQAALANFDYFWSYLLQACGQSSLGNAGKSCISDRQAGACTWKQTASSPYPGTPAVGQCWNWFNGYRDPIANDPNVVQGSPSLSDVISQVGTAGSSAAAGGVAPSFNMSSLLIPALLGGLLIWALS